MRHLTLINDDSIDATNVLVSGKLSQKVKARHNTQDDLNEGRCASSAALLASLLSHDIRHHLSVVYCNAEFLSEPTTPEDERKHLFEEVKLAITDATRVLDFILIHAKTDLPALDATAPLNDLIERTVSVIRPHPHAKGIDITVKESPLVYGLFNKTIVSSAIYNLLLNACFAAQQTREPGRVEISLCDEHKFMCILVKDNGPGVPAEILQDLSHSFGKSSKQSGAGMGITIADYVAREYGGTLQIENSSPGCTIFALRLSKWFSQS